MRKTIIAIDLSLMCIGEMTGCIYLFIYLFIVIEPELDGGLASNSIADFARSGVASTRQAAN